VVTFVSVPHVDAVQATELAIKVHDTPLFEESLFTVAVKTVTLPPAITLPVILFWIVTAMAGGGGGGGGVELPPPHPGPTPEMRTAIARILRRIASSLPPGRARDKRWVPTEKLQITNAPTGVTIGCFP